MDERRADRRAESAPEPEGPEGSRGADEAREGDETREEREGRQTGWVFHPRRGGHSGLGTPPG